MHRCIELCLEVVSQVDNQSDERERNASYITQVESTSG